MEIKSSIKAVLTLEDKTTLAGARTIIHDLLTAMENHDCISKDNYIVSATSNCFDGQAISMYDLECTSDILEIISMSDSLEAEV